MSLPAPKAGLSLFQRPGRVDAASAGRLGFGGGAAVNDLPGKSLKLQKALSSKALTRLDET